MRFIERAAGGAEAGLVTGAAVALFFLFEDAVHLQLLATPSALAGGFVGPTGTEMDGSTVARVAAFGVLSVRVLLYTMAHFVAFALVGIAGAFLLKTSAFWTCLAGSVAYGATVCTGLLYASWWVAPSPVALDALSLPTVLLANAMAGAVLGIGLHLAQMEEGDAGA